MDNKEVLMPSMPGIWNEDKFWESRTYILGAFAKWAVIQSPYTTPDNLEEAIHKLSLHFPEEMFETSYRELIKKLDPLMELIPEIAAWNERKNGNQAPLGFASRYGGPAPDDDFIDLGALARNVAQDLKVRSAYNRVHDHGQ